MAREPRQPRRTSLDQPRELRRAVVPRPSYSPDAFGALAETVARFIGTARFLAYMTIVVVVWIGWNIFLPEPYRFDPYPFIFLTLALSLQASYAAPLILLAQNRQDDRDRVNLDQDREQNDRNMAETEFLTRELAGLRIALGEVATRDFVRGELERLLDELGERRRGERSG